MKKYLIPIVCAVIMVSCGDEKKSENSENKEKSSEEIPYDQLCECMLESDMTDECETLLNEMDELYIGMSDDEKLAFEERMSDCTTEMMEQMQEEAMNGGETGPEIGVVNSPEELEKKCKDLYLKEMEKQMTSDVTDEDIAEITTVLDAYCSCSKEKFIENDFDFSEGAAITNELLMMNTTSCIEDMMISMQEITQRKLAEQE